MLALLMVLSADLPDPVGAPEPAVLSPPAARMLADITTLAAPRFAGRGWPRSPIAADWVADQMEQIGLEPLFPDGSFQQLIPGTDYMVPGSNVAGMLRGTDRPDEYVLVAAHHDHLGRRGGTIYPGADDNASGVAMVLEAARLLVAKPSRPSRSVVFITFDLEENFLWGSRYFVANAPIPLESISLFLVGDMLGRHLGNLPLDEVFVIGSESAPGLTDAITEQADAAGQPIAALGVDIVGTRSDYGPFRKHRVPFAFFSTGEHEDYHQPTDTPDKIDAERLVLITGMIAGTAWQAATADDRFDYAPATPDGVREARSLAMIAGQVLDRHHAGEEQLAVVELLLVERMKTEADAIVAAGRITPTQRTWLVRGAQAMMISVF